MISCRADLFKQLKPKDPIIAVVYIRTGLKDRYFGEMCDVWTKSIHKGHDPHNLARNFPPNLYFQEGLMVEESKTALAGCADEIGYKWTDSRKTGGEYFIFVREK